MSFVDSLKKPSFWMSALTGLGAVGSALIGTGNHVIAAVGAVIVSVYTLAEHIAGAVKEGQESTLQLQTSLKAGNAIAAANAATTALAQQVTTVQQVVADAQQVAKDAKQTAQVVAGAAAKL